MVEGFKRLKKLFLNTGLFVVQILNINSQLLKRRLQSSNEEQSFITTDRKNFFKTICSIWLPKSPIKFRIRPLPVRRISRWTLSPLWSFGFRDTIASRLWVWLWSGRRKKSEFNHGSLSYPWVWYKGKNYQRSNFPQFLQ